MYLRWVRAVSQAIINLSFHIEIYNAQCWKWNFFTWGTQKKNPHGNCELQNKCKGTKNVDFFLWELWILKFDKKNAYSFSYGNCGLREKDCKGYAENYTVGSYDVLFFTWVYTWNVATFSDCFFLPFFFFYLNMPLVKVCYLLLFFVKLYFCIYDETR